MVDRSKEVYAAIQLDPAVLSTPFRAQTNWHVIAGAQCAGKTTLVDRLAGRGFRTLPEGARLFLEQEMEKGRSAKELRASMAILQRGIVETQVSLERELRDDDVVFLDRGVPECMAWWRAYGLDPNQVLGECFHHRYATVFYLDRLPPRGDELRPADDALAAFVDEWTRRDYLSLNYELVPVPVLPIDERVDYVLAQLAGRKVL